MSPPKRRSSNRRLRKNCNIRQQERGTQTDQVDLGIETRGADDKISVGVVKPIFIVSLEELQGLDKTSAHHPQEQPARVTVKEEVHEVNVTVMSANCEDASRSCQKHRRSFPSAVKIKAIELAKAKGNRAAGREFDVDESIIRRWRAMEGKLKSCSAIRKAFRGRSCAQPDLEAQLSEWVQSLRDAGTPVSEGDIRRKALTMAKEKRLDKFFASPGWCKNFLRRQQLSI